MGVLHKAASAFLTVVHALSLLRPGGKRQSGEPKLNVTVHEGKVGRHSQGKYVVTLRHGKERQQTKKKKSDGLVWEHAAEFSHWAPTEPIILKLRKAKRCKDATIAELPIDVAAALESVDGLPSRWWYAIERADDKGRRQKEEVFLQVTITVCDADVKSGSTQVPAKLTKTSTKAAPEPARSTPELQDNSPPSAAVPSSDSDSGRGQVSLLRSKESSQAMSAGPQFPRKERRERQSAATARTPRHHPRPAISLTSSQSLTTTPPSSPPDSFNIQDKTGTRGHGEGDVKVDSERHSFDGPTGDNDSGRGQDPTRSSGKTVMAEGQENPESPAELKELTAVSTDVEAAQVPAYVDIPVSGSASEREQDPAKTSKETAVQQKPEVLEDVMSLPKNEGTDLPTNANSDVDTDKPTTVSSTQGGGVDLPPAIPHPRHKDADDPEYEEVMSSIDNLWDDLLTKRESADELQDYADSLRSKLAATAPHVLNYTVFKNLATHVPSCKSYDLPQTEGLSLGHLKGIQDTLAKLLKDEENRATYLRRWYIDEMCNVALKEAPQVLGAQD
ncbi:Hypp2266 [Branchiostoma lanceolatum]|uniref:Hypp2266 protein n=1 Tax=Branchiostoma lanceolatum TaxID=7740 RepID=A0A8J9ZR42_BRALA|nr:Hypp2266 [Branchiostoma lanceolatum]